MYKDTPDWHRPASYEGRMADFHDEIMAGPGYVRVVALAQAWHEGACCRKLGRRDRMFGPGESCPAPAALPVP